jgi:hypothetical protein
VSGRVVAERLASGACGVRAAGVTREGMLVVGDVVMARVGTNGRSARDPAVPIGLGGLSIVNALHCSSPDCSRQRGGDSA